MSGELLHLGFARRAAMPDVRGAIGLDAAQVHSLQARLAPMARGRMVLSTCERFELYASGVGVTDRQWLRRVSMCIGLSVDVLLKQARILHGDAAARHLLRVAAGLESRIVGEPHVLGQVRAAYRAAIETGALDAVLAALGRAAITTGKRVRTETDLNRAQRSIVTVAVDHLDRAVRSLRASSVVVVGSGTIAADLLAVLQERGVSRLTVVGRNASRVTQLAESYGAQAQGLANLPYAVRETDAIVTCTSAPAAILDASSLELRSRNPLYLVDLAMPNNIDPAVANCPGVCLTNLDDLTDGPTPRTAGVRAAESIVAEEHTRFLAWQRGRAVAETIRRWTREPAHPTGTRYRAHRRALHDRITRLKREAAA